MEAWHAWVLVGLAFIVVEIFTPEMVLGSLAVGVFAAAAAAAMGLTLRWQLVIFMGATLLVMLAVRPRLKQWLHRGADPRPTGTQALIGRTGTVTEPITGDRHPGRVRLGAEEWRALAAPGATIEAGTEVEVVRIEAATVHVKPA